ncbi:MAG: GNAT family N-acetyltransferase, partial [Chloroflexi bacterium]
MGEWEIRPLRASDTAGLHTLLHHPAIIASTSYLPSREFGETANWVQDHKAGQHRLVVERGGELAGLVLVTEFLNPRLRHTAEITLFVHPDYMAEGAGAVLLETAVSLADNWLNISRLEIKPLANDEYTIELCQKAGFVPEGKRHKVLFSNGRYLDDIIMARLHNTQALPGNKTPAPP